MSGAPATVTRCFQCQKLWESAPSAIRPETSGSYPASGAARAAASKDWGGGPEKPLSPAEAPKEPASYPFLSPEECAEVSR